MRNYNRSQEYKLLNKCAQSNKIVLAGSGIAEELYLNELIEDYDLNQKLYNRSIADLKIEDAVQMAALQCSCKFTFSTDLYYRIKR